MYSVMRFIYALIIQYIIISHVLEENCSDSVLFQNPEYRGDLLFLQIRDSTRINIAKNLAKLQQLFGVVIDRQKKILSLIQRDSYILSTCLI